MVVAAVAAVGLVILACVVAIGRQAGSRDQTGGAAPPSASAGSSVPPAPGIVVVSPTGYEMTDVVLAGRLVFTVEGPHVFARSSEDGSFRWSKALDCKDEPRLQAHESSGDVPVVDVSCGETTTALDAVDGSVVWTPKSAFTWCTASSTDPRFVACDHNRAETVVFDVTNGTQVGIIGAEEMGSWSSWHFAGAIVVSALPPGTKDTMPPPTTEPKKPSFPGHGPPPVRENLYTYTTVFDRTGVKRWVRDVPGSVWSTSHGDFAGTTTGELSELAPEDGAARWHVTVGRGAISSIVAGDHVVVAASDDAVVAVDRSTGSEVWRRPRTTRSGVTGDTQMVVIVGEDPAGGAASFDVVDLASGDEIRHIDGVWAESLAVGAGRLVYLSRAGSGAEGRLVIVPVTR